MEYINLQQNFDPNLKMLTDIYYQLQFFSSFKHKCVITKSSDAKFPQYIQEMQPSPFTTFHFSNDQSKTLVTLCCQNLCLLVEIDDSEKFRTTFQKKFTFTNLFPSSLTNDLTDLSRFINLKSVTLPNKKDYNKFNKDMLLIKEIFIPKLFNPENTEDSTVTKFLYFAIDPLLSYSYQRFYYETRDFENPDFFNALQPELDYRDFTSHEFKTLHYIGNGNAGSISLAIHIETGFIVALKSMISKTKRSSYEKTFHKKYRHPFILHCYGDYKENGFIVLVMDYMCNGDLDEYCRDQSFEPSSKTKAIAQILCGIDYLHSFGVMHRDLKPKNILISHDKDFIISDFDTAIRYNSKIYKGDVWTENHMSPEICTGDGISFQSDLYSFGIIVYMLAIGENPFENLTHKEARKRLNDGKINQLSKDYKPIAKLYNRCTRDVKEKRAISFYLLEMLFNETLFFPNSNEEYMYNLYWKIKYIREHVHKLKDREDVQYVIKNANEGEMYAMFNLAVCYHNGWGGFDKDYKKAFEWFTKSAELGHPDSIYDIGNMYYRQRGLQKDFEKAFEFFEKAANMNFIEGYNGLGQMYYNAQVPIKDGQYDSETHLLKNFYPANYKKAFECFKTAADVGYSYSIFNLGKGYFEGHFSKDGKPDYNKAIKWYSKAVEVGNKDAEFNLGWIYLNGIGGVKKAPFQAFELFLKSAAQKLPKAIYQVAIMLRDGVGTERNYSRAAHYYRRAIDLKTKNALIDLAELIRERKVERKDYCDNPDDKYEQIKIGLVLFVGNEKEKNFEEKYLMEDANELQRRADEIN